MRRNRALMMAALALAASAIALDHQHARRSAPSLLEPMSTAPAEAGGYGSAADDTDAPGYGALPGEEAMTEAGGYGVSAEAQEAYGAEAGGYGTTSADEYDDGDD